jgi:hypothetical protein
VVKSTIEATARKNEYYFSAYPEELDPEDSELEPDLEPELEPESEELKLPLRELLIERICGCGQIYDS